MYMKKNKRQKEATGTYVRRKLFFFISGTDVYTLERFIQVEFDFKLAMTEMTGSDYY